MAPQPLVTAAEEQFEYKWSKASYVAPLQRLKLGLANQHIVKIWRWPLTERELSWDTMKMGDIPGGRHFKSWRTY